MESIKKFIKNDIHNISCDKNIPYRICLASLVCILSYLYHTKVVVFSILYFMIMALVYNFNNSKYTGEDPKKVFQDFIRGKKIACSNEVTMVIDCRPSIDKLNTLGLLIVGISNMFFNDYFHYLLMIITIMRVVICVIECHKKIEHKYYPYYIKYEPEVLVFVLLATIVFSDNLIGKLANIILIYVSCYSHCNEHALKKQCDTLNRDCE